MFKIHRPILVGITESLREIFANHRYADKVIEFNLKKNKKWGARDRRLYAEAVYDIVRWWRYLWFVCGKNPSTKENHLIALVGVWCHIRFEEIPATIGKKLSFDEEVIAEQVKEAKKNRAIKESIPDWLDQLGVKELGGVTWTRALPELNRKASAYLRVNGIKSNFEELQASLKEEEILIEKVEGVPGAVKLVKRKNVFKTEAFRKGFFEMQDAASQLVAPMLRLEKGLRVIDACAGAGGKTLHIADLMENKGRIIALDIHERKLIELKRRAKRAGCGIVETRVIEGTKTIKRLKKSADRVLLDVPCSGLGVLRRNPDTKWKLTNDRLVELRAIQKDILFNYSEMVKSGGLLCYATCSVLPSENQKQVEGFITEKGDEWTLLEEKVYLPHVEGFDGFYVSLMQRKS